MAKLTKTYNNQSHDNHHKDLTIHKQYKQITNIKMSGLSIKFSCMCKLISKGIPHSDQKDNLGASEKDETKPRDTFKQVKQFS